MISNHLNKINSLGFRINIIWNESIEIGIDVDTFYLLLTDVIRCDYRCQDIFTFEEMIETACDFFYHWYDTNIELIKIYYISNQNLELLENLEKTYPLDITTRVYRDMGIEDILN